MGYCYDSARRAYLITISILCLTTIVVTMSEWSAKPAWRPVRALLYVCLGCFGLIPFVHFTISWGWASTVTELRPDYILPMGATYILGAGLYAARFPERLFPGKCDLWCQSHQIFHVLVVMAAYRFSPAGTCGLSIPLSEVCFKPKFSQKYTF